MKDFQSLRKPVALSVSCLSWISDLLISKLSCAVVISQTHHELDRLPGTIALMRKPHLSSRLAGTWVTESQSL